MNRYVKEREEEEQNQRLVESPDFYLDNNMMNEDHHPHHHDHHNHHRNQTININRNVIPQSTIFPKYYSKDEICNDKRGRGDRRGSSGCCSSLSTFCHKSAAGFSWTRVLVCLVPMLGWLPKYKWRSDLANDLIAGFTVSVMHIPQGMAYALLGNLPPIVGIYMAFFPVIVYAFLGTSRHVSMGTFAIICLMTGKVVSERMREYEGGGLELNGTYIDDETQNVFRMEEHNHNTKADYDVIEIATTISIVVGFWQFVLGFLRLGSLSLLLSSELVSGFTTGAAIHVLTSQVKSLFGVSIPRRSGLFKIILTYVDIVQRIHKSNVTAIIMSSITIIFLILYNEVLKPLISKKIPFPLPVELVTIIVGTLVSRFWNMKQLFSIEIVNFIPTGLPAPKLPPMDIVSDVLVDGLIIAIVAYAISISMAKIFAIKYNYQVDANQELIAQGASNVVGSFFSCAPISASLSRSLVQDNVGGKTQLAALFSSAILIFVLLWIGPFFETLPNCILSAIIVVALKGMLMQIFDFPKILKQSKLNGFVWIISFVATVTLDIEYGLAVGLGISILTLIWRSNKPNISVLGEYGDSGLYADLHSNPEIKEVNGTKIIKCTGSLNFATVEFFIESIQSIVKIDLKKNKKRKKKDQKRIFRKSIVLNTLSLEKINDSISTDDNLSTSHGVIIESSIDWIILDFSSVSSIDPGGVRSVHSLYDRYHSNGVQILFASCPQTVLEVLRTCNFLGEIGFRYFFPSIHDAVIFSGSMNNNRSGTMMSTISNINANESILDTVITNNNLQHLDSILTNGNGISNDRIIST